MASSGTGRGARTARKAPQPEDMAVDCPGARKSFKRTLGTVHSEAAPSSGGATLWALQGTAGNGAVVRVLRSRQEAMPRGLQAKLMVGAANDPLEREADRVADLVMRMGSSRSASGRADEVDEAPVQRLADPGQDPASAFEADTAVASRLTARRGGGQPLPPAVRNRMEAGFGADFSEVRIHRDAEASDLSTGLAARAFTHGADIYFAAGAYDPGSHAGRHLLAHELTHVVQQGGASLHRTFEPRGIVALQRAAGNRATAALLQGARDAGGRSLGYEVRKMEADSVAAKASWSSESQRRRPVARAAQQATSTLVLQRAPHRPELGSRIRYQGGVWTVQVSAPGNPQITIFQHPNHTVHLQWAQANYTIIRPQNTQDADLRENNPGAAQPVDAYAGLSPFDRIQKIRTRYNEAKRRALQMIKAEAQRSVVSQQDQTRLNAITLADFAVTRRGPTLVGGGKDENCEWQLAWIEGPANHPRRTWTFTIDVDNPLPDSPQEPHVGWRVIAAEGTQPAVTNVFGHVWLDFVPTMRV